MLLEAQRRALILFPLPFAGLCFFSCTCQYSSAHDAAAAAIATPSRAFVTTPTRSGTPGTGGGFYSPLASYGSAPMSQHAPSMMAMQFGSAHGAGGNGFFGTRLLLCCP